MKIRDIAPFSLRMTDDLRDRLEAARKKSGRSMNAEVLWRVEKGLLDRSLDQYSDGDLIKELVDRHGLDNILIRIGKGREK